jgi:hypothetical protein
MGVMGSTKYMTSHFPFQALLYHNFLFLFHLIIFSLSFLSLIFFLHCILLFQPSLIVKLPLCTEI